VPGSGEVPVYSESATLKVARSAPQGAYDVCIALPDTRLPNDARQSIRPANADDAGQGQRWDAGLGAFCVGTATVN
jgi:hypothetical protein